MANSTKRRAHGKQSHWRNAGFYLRSELISNGDMETGGSDPWVPTGWANVDCEAGELAQDNVDPHAGTYCLHLDVNTAGEGIATNALTVVVGDILRTSLWLKRVSGSLNLLLKDGDGTSLKSIDLSSGYADWIEKVFDTTVLNAGSSCLLQITATGGPAEWYIDDVGIKARVEGHSFSSSSGSSESSESSEST